ncbi:serine/threonine-protein kinase pim-1-like [Amia ocellicauda]|uniref:serine/threonine-protein kinase pim-1-like n=1 Tax=Amia ocellicauda TaxID=2972642 RepID=UPI00346491F4
MMKDSSNPLNDFDEVNFCDRFCMYKENAADIICLLEPRLSSDSLRGRPIPPSLQADTISAAQAIQRDLDNIQLWADTWQMKFNVDKCKVIHAVSSTVREDGELHTPVTIEERRRKSGVKGQGRRKCGSSNSAQRRQTQKRKSSEGSAEGDGTKRVKLSWLPSVSSSEEESLSSSLSSTSESDETDSEPFQSLPVGSRCPERDAFIEKYSESHLLGAGGFGRVYAGLRRQDGLKVAIKHIPIRRVHWEEVTLEANTVRLPRELIIMLMVGTDTASSGVIQLLDWYQLPEEVLLVQERPDPCKDLFKYAVDQGDCLEESEARSFMKQLIKTIQHCHERRVLHRDIKPENILVQLDTGKLKLIDFGCACILHDSVYNSFSGTSEYKTPEWLLHGGYRGVPATIWSLGVLLFDVVCGYLPFSTDEEIVHGVLDFPSDVSTDCQDLIRTCLAHNPEDRPTLEQILRHPWLRSA